MQIAPSPTWTDCCRYGKWHHWCIGACAPVPGGQFRVIWEKKHLRDCQLGVLHMCLCSALISEPPDGGCTGPPWSTHIHEISLNPSVLKPRVLGLHFPWCSGVHVGPAHPIWIPFQLQLKVKHQKFYPMASLAMQKWGSIYIFLLLDSSTNVVLYNLTYPPLCKIYSFKSYVFPAFLYAPFFASNNTLRIDAISFLYDNKAVCTRKPCLLSGSAILG